MMELIYVDIENVKLVRERQALQTTKMLMEWKKFVLVDAESSPARMVMSRSLFALMKKV